MPALVLPDDIQWFIDNKLTHQLHTSERKAFRACRRRWNWAYRDMYSPQVTAAPLEFGIAFHKAMEVFYEPRTWTADNFVRTDLACVTFRRECDKQLRAYKKNIDPDPDVTVLDEYKTRIDLGLNMIRYYCETMSPVYDRKWTPVRVEVGFEVPLKHTDSEEYIFCKCKLCWKRVVRASVNLEQRKIGKEDFINQVFGGSAVRNDDGALTTPRDDWKGLPVTYGGRLDALFQDEHGRYWIADWKTTARLLDEDAESSFLQLDDQVSSYLWALSQYGINCAGFVYVEIKKTFPQAPERLSRSYKGRAFSTNKQALTTYELANRVFAREDHDAWQMGFYDEYLRFLQGPEGPKFTQRHQIHKNAHEIEAIGQDIVLEALDMIGQPRIYPMPGRFSCNWCLFKQPCLGKNMGEDYQYTLDTMFDKFDKFYWEERESSTD